MLFYSSPFFSHSPHCFRLWFVLCFRFAFFFAFYVCFVVVAILFSLKLPFSWGCLVLFIWVWACVSAFVFVCAEYSIRMRLLAHLKCLHFPLCVAFAKEKCELAKRCVYNFFSRSLSLVVRCCCCCCCCVMFIFFLLVCFYFGAYCVLMPFFFIVIVVVVVAVAFFLFRCIWQSWG